MKSDESSPIRLKLIFRALRYRNYRLFFGGQSISLIGTWLTQIATSWLVYRLSNSVLLLGVIGFVSQIPIFLLTPFAGVLVDRWNRHRTLVITQTLSMMQSLALAILTLTGVIEVWHIILLCIFQGLINAFDVPARQAFVVEMVAVKEDLGSAIALNSSMFNSARLLGPSIAGLLIAAFGEGVCFLIDGISYLAVIVALLAMKIKLTKIESQRANVLHGLKEGFTHAFGFVPIRAILLLLGLVGLAGMPYIILMPVFAANVLHGGPHTYGFLMGASGVGAVAGAVYLASRKSVRGLGKIISLASGIFGLGLILFSISRVFWLSLLLMVFTGLGMMMQVASSNTVLQTIVDDDKRGRIMSFYTMAFMGMSPFGSLLAGLLASKIGAPNTLLVCGALCILGAFLFSRSLPRLREMVRPIYERMGIIPEVAQGIEIATELTIPPKN
jgi:MFS family permease